MPGYTGGCLWTNFEGFFKAIDDFSINTAWNDVLGNKTDSPVVIQVCISCAPTDGRRRLKSSLLLCFVSKAGFARGATP